jgi:hypothetical protein
MWLVQPSADRDRFLSIYDLERDGYRNRVERHRVEQSGIALIRPL